MSMDIIIPVLNEEEALRENFEYYLSLKGKADIIFVDGGSTDQTILLASKLGQVLQSLPSRALQKNIGARAATSDMLLFLHVDTLVDVRYLDQICSSNKALQAGCLHMHIDDPKWIFRFYEWLVNLRARYMGIVDGDLGLFVKRRLFLELGGFENLPIMDDIAFSKKLRKVVKIHPIAVQISVSSRRWYEEGFLKTFIRYSMAYVQHWTGIRFFKHKHAHG